MIIKSPAFKNNEYIPAKYTCQGDDISPPLLIQDIPDNAKSLALIMDDPDAPMGTWIHWVIFNIPLIDKIEENAVPGTLGTNDSNPDGTYGGTCPPSGVHRYFFKIYALDILLDIAPGITKGELESAMKGHIIEEAAIVGLYKKE